MVPSAADVLMVDGWRSIVDVSVGDRVATLNVEKNEIQYAQIEVKTQRAFSGSLIRIRNSSTFNFLSTDDHNVLLWKRSGQHSFVPASEVCSSFELGKCAWLHHSGFRRSGVWIGNDYEFCDVPGLGCVRTELWAAFIGIYVAEGFAAGTVKKENRRVYAAVSQVRVAHPENYARIEALLSELGILDAPWERGFHLNVSDELYEHLYTLGSSHFKHLPVYAKEWSPRFLDVLLTWMLMGDGRNRKNFGKLLKEYATTSKKLADDAFEVMFKLGYGSTIHTYQPIDRPAPDHKETGRMILAENSMPMNIVYMHTSKSMSLDFRFMRVEKQFYEGDVHDIIVPNGTWLMRQSNRSLWTCCDSAT